MVKESGKKLSNIFLAGVSKVPSLKKFLLSITFQFYYYLFFDCANQLPPGGGEVDKIPPKIIEVYPAQGTINFKDDYFEIGFSEYVINVLLKMRYLFHLQLMVL